MGTIQEGEKMEIETLKPKLGRWLSIEELKGFFAQTPEEICKGIPINRKFLESASRFVEEKHGWWEHPDWEAYLNSLRDEGFKLTDEARDQIGYILEIFKAYYHGDNFKAITDKRRKPAGRRASTTRKTKPRSAKKA